MDTTEVSCLFHSYATDKIVTENREVTKWRCQYIIMA